ncbi:MAG: hypothetical protein AB7K09_14090 [Planctomycetota bacterium]
MQDNLGDMLVMAGLITDKQLATAKDYVSSLGGDLPTILTKMGFVDDKKLTEFLAMQEELEVVDIESMVIPVDLVRMVPRELILKHHVLPVHASKDVITLAMADPTDFAAIDEIQFVTGKRVEVNLAPREKLNNAIRGFFDVMDGETDDRMLRDLASDPAIRSLHPSKSKMPKVSMKKKFEVLAPALLPVLLEKKIVTEAELKAMLEKLKAMG